MDPLTIACAGLVLLAGSVLQCAAGFGYGMFAVPLLMLVGLASYEAIAMVSVSVAVQAAWSAWLHRRDFVLGQVIAMVLLASATVPVGVAIQGVLADSDPALVRQVFGGVVLGILVLQWLWRLAPRERVAWPWMLLAFPASGVMSGLAGMGGPPAVIWVMAHAWPSARSRATLWALFAGLTPVQLAVLAFRFEPGAVGAAAGLGALMIPFTLLGMKPGLWIGRRLSPTALRRTSVTILLLVSLYAITQPWLAALMPRG